MLTAVFLINRVASQSLQKSSPLHILLAEFPLIKLNDDLPKRVFDCECNENLHPNQTKLTSRALRSVFVGYSNTHKGYNCKNPTRQRIINSRDVLLLM